jgi:hypothetical protein
VTVRWSKSTFGIAIATVDCGSKEAPEGREFAIEQVVDEAVDLQLLGELIRAMQVRDPVVGELGVLVGVVANKPLATDPR